MPATRTLLVAAAYVLGLAAAGAIGHAQAPRTLHLEERLDQARVTAAAAAPARSALEWRFDAGATGWQPAAPWNPTIDAAGIAHVAGALRVTLSAGTRNANGIPAAGIMVELPDSSAGWPGEEWREVVVRARGDGVINQMGLRFNLRPGRGSASDFPNPFLRSGASVEVVGSDTVRTYRMSLAGAPRAIRELGLWFFTDGEPGSIDIVSISLLPVITYHGRSHGVADVRGRPGVFVRTPASVSWTIAVPESGRLDVGIGATGSRAPATFRVRVAAGGDAVTVLEETRADGGHWAQRGVDLSAFAGRVVQLVLEADGEPGTIAFWREPVVRPSAAPALAPRPCDALLGMRIPSATITATETGGGGAAELPGHCRVRGVIQPSVESAIQFEVLLPVDSWTGRFVMVGNGGWAGLIPSVGLAEQIRLGNAAAASNTGHPAGPGLEQARFAYESHERLIDFAHRAQRETTRVAREIVAAFYGVRPRYSYWVGGSTGGYQGLRAAQEDPLDFDGIIAGMPANNWTRLMAGHVDGVAAMAHDRSNNLDAAALDVLHRAAVAACDERDGVRDGVIANPLRCPFDPGILLCAEGRARTDCLNPTQVAAARRIYAGFRHPQTGERLFPGQPHGTELMWQYIHDPDSPFIIPLSHFRWVVLRDSLWHWREFDPASPAGFASFLDGETRLAALMNATQPDLSAFRKQGGRLLQWHGWADAIITPYSSIEYYESVRALMGDVDDFYRLFMVPALQHQWPRADMQAVLELGGARHSARLHRRSRARRRRCRPPALRVPTGAAPRRTRRPVPSLQLPLRQRREASMTFRSTLLLVACAALPFGTGYRAVRSLPVELPAERTGRVLWSQPERDSAEIQATGRGRLTGVTLAASGSGLTAGISGRSWRTGDGGITWTRVEGAAPNVPAVALRDDGVALASAGNGRLFRSEDAGLNWTQVWPPGQGAILRIRFVTRDTVIAVGQEVALRSTDGGSEWTKLDVPKQTWFDVRFSSDSHGYLVGGAGLVMVTTDAGDSWQRRHVSTDAVLRRIHLFDPDHALVIGTGGAMFRTRDGGRSWDAVDSSTRHHLRGLAFRDELNGIAVGFWGTILRTRDGGHSWQEENGGTDVHLTDVAYAPDGTPVIVGLQDALLRGGAR
jgi:feruloyl esterase